MSTLRATLGGGNETQLSPTSIVAADTTNAIAFSRTTDQVCISSTGRVVRRCCERRVFPNGLNGNITKTARKDGSRHGKYRDATCGFHPEEPPGDVGPCGTALAALAFAPKAEAAAVSDNDILNFALNLEYLEAQFYNLAVHGVTIDHLPTPIPGRGDGGTAGTVALKPNFSAVTFSQPLIASYALETATEEGKHVLFLQNVLGMKAVSMPNIDLYQSFKCPGDGCRHW